MLHAAILVCDPAHPSLSEAHMREAARVIGTVAEPAWLGADVAAQITFDVDPAAAPEREAALRGHFGELPLDIAVVPVAGRRKKLLVADMDSTMIRQECLDELAAEFGLKAHISAITERAMRGEIAFEPALRERVALLAGMDAGAIGRVLDRLSLMPGGQTLVRTMRRHGGYTALVSGGFTAFTGPVAARIGFDENRGNVLLIEDGRLTGRVQHPVLGRDAKRATLFELRQTRDLDPSETMAVGDGANDLSMIEIAGLGVAFHAKPAVAAVARVRIDHGDLTALLYLQGYRRDEFVEEA